MTKQELLSELEDIMELDSGSLKETDLLADLDMWDSLAVVSFIAVVDAELELTLEPEKIAKSETVSDLIALVSGKLEG